MANLKEELDEYLNRNSDSKPLLNGLPSVNVSIPKVGSWFRKNDADEQEGWYANAQKDCCPALSRMQRIMGFCICIGMGVFCFTIAAMYIPVLFLKARKFSLLYTMGSLFMICSFSFLWGPMTHLKHLFSKERFWFTFTYVSTMSMTLYFALYQHSTPFTVLSAVFQLIALLWFLMSYIPGGHTGLLFFTKLCASSVSKTLPV
ncbi:hypothetical protein GE061_011661 [Apolygus lucorum]|uniref:Vesicle transport protein n=1 Tax=Apolygus lucorum TaxID=248454 RepID=A0A6A4K8B2_APOLU|nr:hypothetical protein GE061_011661 [Apolygus lucorum]